MAHPWELAPPAPEVGDETPLLIVDREDGSEGRTICIVQGNLSRRIADADFVRLLAEQDLANARAIPLLPHLRTARADLIERAAHRRLGRSMLRNQVGKVRCGVKFSECALDQPNS